MNKSLCRLLLLWVFLVPARTARCQDFPMLHFTNDNGLPGNVVYQVYCDNKGFLWFGTDKGVARYNGVKFEVFTTFNGLPDNEVHMFCEDLYERLWLVTANGEPCYYKDDTFHTARNTSLLRLPFPANGLRIITRQSDSSVILASTNSKKMLNFTDNGYQVIDISRLDKESNFGQLIYRQKITSNRYKFTFANGILIADTMMNVKQKFDVDTFRTDIGGNTQFFSCSQDQDYLFNKSRIFYADMKYKATFPIDFHKNYYLNQVFFHLSNKFYATNAGLFINDSIHVLKEYNITSVGVGRYGNYWISTLNNGVFVLKKDFLNTKLHKGIYEGQVLYSYSQSGQLFFATTNNNLYHLRDNNLNCLVNYAQIRNEKYRQNTTRAYLVDSNYRYFNIADHDFIFRQNAFENKSIMKYVDVGNDGKTLHYLNGYMYVQKPGSIIRFNIDPEANKQIKYYTIGISRKDDKVMCMEKDNANALWYSTLKGLYKISDTGIVTAPRKFRNIPLKAFGFLNDNLIGYTNNNLMLVFRNIYGNMTVDTIVRENCIWDKLYWVDSHNMLISTNNLYRLLTLDDKQGNKNYRLTVIDDPFIPLQPDAVVSDGKVCYFMKGGFVSSFAKACLFAKPPPPKLFFTDLRSVSKLYNISKRVVIPFRESKNMIISFSIVSQPGSNIICQYSISKNDRDYWTDIKGEEISFVNSGSGNYTVKIRAKTTSSDFCTPVEFTLRVRRPFWVTWWFISLSIALVIYFISLIARQRLIYVLKQKDKKHEMTVRFMKSEYKALNALMNPHFIFNTLNNVQGLINKNDKQAANEYLRVIADLIRQNMHNISKELIPLQKEMELVNNYLLLEKLRFKDKLNYFISIDKGVDLSEIMIPPLLIQPLVENSIKHGILRLESKEGSIYVNIFERNGSLVIEVKDNGVGLNFKKSEKLSTHQSFGLENIRKRIEQLSVIQGKEISFDIKERRGEMGAQWTVATIIIPYSD